MNPHKNVRLSANFACEIRHTSNIVVLAVQGHRLMRNLCESVKGYSSNVLHWGG